MTFRAQEDSVEEGAPVYLYSFVYGPNDGDRYDYTDVDREIVYDNITYSPVVIDHGQLRIEDRLQDEELVIDVDPSTDLATRVLSTTPVQPIAATVREGHADDPDAEFVVIWVGSIKARELKDDYLRLQINSAFQALRRVGLKRRYQRTCPWALYEQQCRAVRRVRAVISSTAIGPNNITVTQGWNGSLAREKFTGGYVEWNGAAGTHRRMIIRIENLGATDRITFQGSTEEITDATALNAFAGCNRQVADCMDLHDNIVNFGGQNRIPLLNPAGSSNRFEP